MSDVDLSDIIEFIQHLKRGFDKDLFQRKIEELAYVAETTGIESDDFHTLFKLWLNLSIPISKWVSLGACLVPQDRIEERTLYYAFRWLLANCDIFANYSRMAFLLDWLTAAMETESIDMKALDSGYDIFFSFLNYEVLTVHVLKLVYNLTRPADVTRNRVLELLKLTKLRENQKKSLRQIQVLLGLFKSYRPECVPEDVPAISIHTSFKKINANLLERFKCSQERRQTTKEERSNLIWTNPLNSECRGNKKVDPLLPNMMFSNIGSKQYAKEQQKTHLDFSDPVSLVQYSLQQRVSRPARLRSLLCNQTGLALLAIASEDDQAFFSCDLHHLLTTCFLEPSPYSYVEKADLLARLGTLQRTLLQGIPAVSRFLAQFLPFWNEAEYFEQILTLVEWISVDGPDELQYIVGPLSRAYYRAEPLQQCAILRALTNMYCNLAFSSTRKRSFFVGSQAPNQAHLLPYVASEIADMAHKGLQINPNDMRLMYSTLQCAEACAGAELRQAVPVGSVPRRLTLAMPLLTPVATYIDKIAALLALYKRVFSQMKAANKNKDPSYAQQRKVLESYHADFLHCLYHEQALSERQSGLIFNNLRPQLVEKLSHLIPDVDAKLSLRNSLAFAPYRPLDEDDAYTTNKDYFDMVVSHLFPNLSDCLVRTVRELR